MSEAESSFVRLAAAMALVDIAPDAGPTIVPVLREMEALPDWRVRNTAKIGRWKIEREGPSPIEELLSATSDSPFVQGSQRLPLNHSYLDTIKLLGWLGPEAKAALPELIGIVTTNSLTPLRLRAADAIRRIDPQTYHKLRLPGPLALPDTASE